MDTQVLVGRILHDDDTPYEGKIMFVPRDLWVMEHGICVARLAPVIELDEGRFVAELSLGKYTVHTPIGSWKIRVRKCATVDFLSNHLPSRYK